MTTCWQSLQSRDTKNLNLERLGRHSVHCAESGAKKRKRQSCGSSWRVMNKKTRSPESQPKMESTVYLVAAWISFREMKAPHSVCTHASTKARNKENEEFLSDQDNQVWKEMSEEWQQY